MTPFTHYWVLPDTKKGEGKLQSQTGVDTGIRLGALYPHPVSIIHKTEGKLFVEAVMLRLLEQGLSHSSSPGDALSGGVHLCITVPAF
ncbi:MAG: hypothetical protein FRX49_05030 [Trebouxia sp. A1-2]|nr:MAG: hypothetical protein FRX49_05030 [Trebouxia sp. A1-2]